MNVKEAEIILKTSQVSVKNPVVAEAMDVGGKCCEIVSSIIGFVEESAKLNDSDLIPKDLFRRYIDGCLNKED